MPDVVEVLVGHRSAETAYIIADYPCGRVARCVKRVWVEANKHGMRLIEQTSIAKYKMEAKGWKEGEPVPDKFWNRPKSGTYSRVVAIFLDEVGHVQSRRLDRFSGTKHVEVFERVFSHLIENDPETARLIEYQKRIIEEANRGNRVRL